MTDDVKSEEVTPRVTVEPVKPVVKRGRPPLKRVEPPEHPTVVVREVAPAPTPALKPKTVLELEAGRAALAKRQR